LGRDLLDLRTEFLLNAEQVHAIVVGDEVDGNTQVAESARAADSVQVCFRVLGEVKVDDNVDGLNIDTTSEKIRRYQVTAGTVAEVMEYAVTVRLYHLGVNVEARISELRDLSSEQLDTSHAVAENDGLIDLKFAEERVQAVNLLLLFDKGIVLGDTLECELFHEVDDIRLAQVLVLEVLHGDGESGRVQ